MTVRRPLAARFDPIDKALNAFEDLEFRHGIWQTHQRPQEGSS